MLMCKGMLLHSMLTQQMAECAAMDGKQFSLRINVFLVAHGQNTYLSDT